MMAYTIPVFGSSHGRSARYDESALLTAKIPKTVIVDSIVVHKQARQMLVFSRNRLIKIYKVHLGKNPVGHKEMQGDYKTPEGLYYIKVHNPNSLYHKSLGISYPNAQDIARAKKIGKAPGGDIMIHGLPNFDSDAAADRYQNDWTWGCIAVCNEEIDELFECVSPNTPVYITP
jgi:murein L,D-transpeptidase YafK